MGSAANESLLAEKPYAHLGLRFLAWLIDSLIMGVLILPVMIITFWASFVCGLGEGMRSSSPKPFISDSDLTLWGGFGFCLLLLWLYYAWMESSKKRATLGKLIFRLQVVNKQGEKLSFWRASVRILSRFGHTFGFAFLAFRFSVIITYFITGGFYIIQYLEYFSLVGGYLALLGSTIGYLSALRTPQKQTLHDLIAGTVVVKKVKQTPSETAASFQLSQDP